MKEMDGPSIEVHGLYGEFHLFIRIIDQNFKFSSNDI